MSETGNTGALATWRSQHGSTSHRLQDPTICVTRSAFVRPQPPRGICSADQRIARCSESLSAITPSSSLATQKPGSPPRSPPPHPPQFLTHSFLRPLASTTPAPLYPPIPSCQASKTQVEWSSPCQHSLFLPFYLDLSFH